MPRKLTLFFVVFLFVNLALVVTDTKFFPSVRFPHFQNRSFGDTVVFADLSLLDGLGKPVDPLRLIQPYDKRFVLFAERFLIDPSTRGRMLDFLDERAVTRNIPVPLRVKVEEKNSPVEK